MAKGERCGYFSWQLSREGFGSEAKSLARRGVSWSGSGWERLERRLLNYPFQEKFNTLHCNVMRRGVPYFFQHI